MHHSRGCKQHFFPLSNSAQCNHTCACLCHVICCLKHFSVLTGLWMIQPCLLIPYYCCNKLSQISRLKTTEMHSPTVPEAESEISLLGQKSRCQQGLTPSGSSGRNLFLHLFQQVELHFLAPPPSSNPVAQHLLRLGFRHVAFSSLTSCPLWWPWGPPG